MQMRTERKQRSPLSHVPFLDNGFLTLGSDWMQLIGNKSSGELGGPYNGCLSRKKLTRRYSRFNRLVCCVAITFL